MSIPTEGDLYAQIIEHIRKVQELTAMMGHLTGENNRRITSNAWLKVSENFKMVQHVVTQIAMGKMH